MPHHSIIAGDIHRQGWSVVPGYLSEAEARELHRESREAWEHGDFRRAGVGRGGGLRIREGIRTDHVMWLDPPQATASQRAYLTRLESLRAELNRRLFLGLMDFEGHFAIYPEGGFYKPHLDRHLQSMDRVATVILYLNPEWEPGHGGELKLWTEPDRQDGPCEVIEPRLGTLVCFLSGDHWHEVLPAARTRASVTGWFRCRS